MNATAAQRMPPASLVLLGTALAYAAVGVAALALAIPPTYVAPLYPSAGIALAAALTYGPAALPGVWLGAFAVNAYAASLRGPPDAAALLVPAALGVGAMLQAGAGRWLVRRLAGARSSLSEPREVALFFGVAVPLSCVVAAALATLVFAAADTADRGDLPFVGWTWWAGDTLGVLIGAPIALTLIGRPRSEWAHRRVSVGLALLLTTGLLAAAIVQVARWDEQRVQGRFDRDARTAAAALGERLQQPLHTLQTLRSLYVASEQVTDAELAAAMAPWLVDERGLRAIGRSVWIDAAARAALEQSRRSEGLADFRVFDRAEAGGTEAVDAPMMVITQVEPPSGNRAALGLNQMSIPPVRVAIERARRTGTAVASEGFALTQGGVGVVVYQVLYDGEPATAAERVERTAGLVFVTVEPERLLRAVRDAQPAYLRLCLIDTDANVPHRVLAGDAGCADTVASDARLVVQPLAFAGRQWDIRVSAERGAVPDAQAGSALLFSLVALAAASLLGALLLTVTGRTRRIEVAVDTRTADLRHEVTERRRTEAALREREQQLRAIFDTTPVGIAYTDLDGRILAPNPAFCALLGRDAAELVGRDVGDFTHPDDLADGRERQAAMRRGECDSYRVRKRYLRADGAAVQAQLTAALLRDDEGRPHRTVGVIEDIGEHLRLLQAERERDAAAAANRAKSEFVSRMSHELRTPLNAMLGFAQLLELDRDPALAPHQHGWAAQIQHAGWHLLHMINDTLDLSRIEAGTLRLQAEALDLRELVDACTALIERAARERGLRLTVDIHPQARAVTGDLTRVKQVLTNLLSNAVKYNVDGGAVRVRTRPAGDALVAVEVADTGLGMSDEQLAHLFEPFNRLGRESGSVEGTGIGLVIARRLAELMGGSLHATSRPGTTCFTLMLPGADVPASTPSPATAGTPPAARYRERVVHYVEDNTINAEVMRGILLQRPQVRLEVSTNGADALDALKRDRPHLVLLDMHLPDLDGLDLLRRLKDDPDTETIPVVALSADATRDRVEQALREGASHYLTKPVAVQDLLAVVDELLERQETRFG
ncbi:CHASE domain-containing protein [Azohydromonas sp.]|uniref:CHASE domain-containing protein n=1 Tax=Azohydromonas sp. TaxID=1872666 RepID=UPI002C7E0CFB|nr:CHASE domain-containing protein [Azohydromonas sp.]HMM86943.1 CHASE domain-containing protein [Azohydromonas sp.]